MISYYWTFLSLNFTTKSSLFCHFVLRLELRSCEDCLSHILTTWCYQSEDLSNNPPGALSFFKQELNMSVS